MSNEQWKEDGKCNICRKQNYCGKPCKAAQDRKAYEMSCLISQAMFKAMRGK